MKVHLQRIWIQVTADKRKFGLLCGVAAMGLLLWGRLILTSNVPRTVVAQPKEPVGDASDISGLHSGRTKPAQVIELWSTPSRDPFVISPLHFPAPTLGVKTGEAGKSGDQSAENHERTASAMLEQIRTLAMELKLEAVLTEPPMAVINGRNYRQGSFITPSRQAPFRFQLVEVRTRSVILECEGHRFERQIPTPRGDQSDN